MVKAAQDLNAGKPVLDDTTVTNASASSRFKVPESEMPAFVARNHAAIANRHQAIQNLLAFFQGGKGAPAAITPAAPQPTLSPKAAKILKELTADNNATLDIDLHWRWDQQLNGPHCVSIDLTSGGRAAAVATASSANMWPSPPRPQRQLLQFLAHAACSTKPWRKAGGDACRVNASTMRTSCCSSAPTKPIGSTSVATRTRSTNCRPFAIS